VSAISAFLATYGFLIVSMALAALLALSLYIPFLAGQLSLASPGFYALGGYIAAVLATRVLPSVSGFSSIPSLLLEMALAAVAAGLLAVVVGLPALRLRGIYFALATIAFVEILRVLSLNLEITGGAVGIFGVPQPFSTQLGYLWIVAPLLVAGMAFMWRLERTRAGRALVALREDELAADAMGINPTYYRRWPSRWAPFWPAWWGRSAPTSSTRGTRVRGHSTRVSASSHSCSSAARGPSWGRSWAGSSSPPFPRCSARWRTWRDFPPGSRASSRKGG
jgi:hypothetical protein